MSVDKKYIKNLQGKDFILYAGLLDLGHRNGLKSIQTKLIQAPTEDNGNTAIVGATVTLESGSFDGIGDASPANVNRGIAVHIIRMAETRAKARALRDATNVDMAAFEEMGGDDDEPEPAKTSSQRRHPAPTTAPKRTPEEEAFTAAMTEARKAVKSAGMRVTDGDLTKAINSLVANKIRQGGSEQTPTTAIINYVSQAIAGKPELLLNVLAKVQAKAVDPEAPFVPGGAA